MVKDCWLSATGVHAWQRVDPENASDEALAMLEALEVGDFNLEACFCGDERWVRHGC